MTLPNLEHELELERDLETFRNRYYTMLHKFNELHQRIARKNSYIIELEKHLERKTVLEIREYLSEKNKD